MSNFPSTGAACLCPAFNVKIKKLIRLQASIYAAEFIAISKALNVIIENPRNSFLIFSDSLSSLQDEISINTNAHIMEIKKKYREYLSANPLNSITFHWIPSFIGLQDNEDLMATEASISGNFDIRIRPFSDFYEEFQRNQKENTTILIRELGPIRGTNYFEYFYRETNKPWYGSRNLSRELIVTMNRIRANHYNLA